MPAPSLFRSWFTKDRGLEEKHLLMPWEEFLQ